MNQATHRDPHARAVDAWFDRVGGRHEDVDRLGAFEATFAALWRRARATLGEVTLVAITQRVLFDAAEKFPAFGVVAVDHRGLRCEPASKQLRSMTDADLCEATRFVLLTWLTVLGNVTGDILTAALHAALASAAVGTAGRGNAAHANRKRKDRSR